MNLKQAVNYCILCNRSENRSKRTDDWIANAARQLDAFIGDDSIDVKDIDANLIRRFSLSLDERPAFGNHPFNKPRSRPVSPETKSNYMRGLQSIFRRLTDEGMISQNPMAKIKMPKVPVREPEIMSEEDIISLFGAIDKRKPNGYRDFTMFMILLDTGERVSELCSMELNDVDLQNGYLRVMGKGNKERHIPIGYKLTKVLFKYMTNYRPSNTGSTYLFITKDGNPLNRNRVAKILRGYVNKAGITGKRIHPHTFRATKAVFFLRHGGDVFSLQKCLGHATLTMTRKYSAIADSDVKSAHLKYGVVDRMKI